MSVLSDDAKRVQRFFFHPLQVDHYFPGREKFIQHLSSVFWRETDCQVSEGKAPMRM